ncbi:MAG: hypothetical protein A2521_08785 [Deltaproteobacteria bacterium RIFOXYD12_FULL_57_12]|nr:MAG: hypothetical protein A2521_08785 [Deltaproteobacteria bacterium RIFOXYD12_FULL_57_12]
MMGIRGVGGQSIALRHCFPAYFLGAVVIILVLLSGCLAEDGSRGGAAVGKAQQPVGNAAQVSAFLQLKEPAGPSLQLSISRVEILANGIWTELSVEPRRVDAAKLAAGQLLLCRNVVEPGRYQALRLTLAEAGVFRVGRSIPLTLASTQVELPLAVDLDLAKGDSKSLFITLDTVASLLGGDTLTPVLSAVVQTPPLVADLLYVACPSINTVYLVRCDKNWVSGSIGISGRPTYLGADAVGKRLYVLASGEAVINVIESATNRIVDKLRIPMVMEPGFMTVSPDGGPAYILDSRSGNVVRLELPSGRLAAQVRLGERPEYAAFLAEQGLLAVSSAMASTVSLLNTTNLATVQTITAGNSPEGMAGVNGILYIAERAANTVMLYDLKTGRIRDRLHVGFGPRRILVSNNQIYVASSNPAIGVLLVGQLSTTAEIATTGKPLEMAAADRRRWIYAAGDNPAGLTVIDNTTNRPAGFIELGAPPLGMAVLQ